MCIMSILGGFVPLLLHLFSPQHCPSCGALGLQYCPDCLSAAAALPLPPFCSECGGAWDAECCFGRAPCYAAALHDGAARAFILALKYKNMRSLGAAIGYEMARRLPAVEADLLIPLPLHRGSSRAYNQTELMADAIALRRAAVCAPELLRWRRANEAQVGRSARARRALSFDSFEASPEIAGKRIILVDDVYTTGGTVRAAKFAIERAGGKVAAVYLWTRRVSSPEDPRSWPESAGELEE